MYLDKSISVLGAELQADYYAWLTTFTGWLDDTLPTGADGDLLGLAMGELHDAMRSIQEMAELEAWLNSGYIPDTTSGALMFPPAQELATPEELPLRLPVLPADYPAVRAGLPAVAGETPLSGVGFSGESRPASRYPTPLPPPLPGEGAILPDGDANALRSHHHREDVPPAPLGVEGGKGGEGQRIWKPSGKTLYQGGATPRLHPATPPAPAGPPPAGAGLRDLARRLQSVSYTDTDAGMDGMAPGLGDAPGAAVGDTRGPPVIGSAFLPAAGLQPAHDQDGSPGRAPVWDDPAPLLASAVSRLAQAVGQDEPAGGDLLRSFAQGGASAAETADYGTTPQGSSNDLLARINAGLSPSGPAAVGLKPSTASCEARQGGLAEPALAGFPMAAEPFTATAGWPDGDRLDPELIRANNDFRVHPSLPPSPPAPLPPQRERGEGGEGGSAAPARDDLERLGRELAGALAHAGAAPAAGPQMPGPADWRQLLAMLPLHTDRRELPPTMAGATAEAAAASSAAPASDEVAHGAGRAPLAALSPLEQARGTPTSPGPASAAVDLQDILDALAREIEREYRRFYGPA